MSTKMDASLEAEQEMKPIGHVVTFLKEKYDDGMANVVLMNKKYGMRCRILPGYEDVPYVPFVTAKGLAALQTHFMPTASDIFVTTSPKCGTTWTQQIVLLILMRGDVSKLFDMQAQAPWVERWVCATDVHPLLGKPLDLDSLNLPDGGPLAIDGRRVFKTHAPVAMFPAKGKHWGAAKIVYVNRNPKDAAVSAFHHNSGLIEHQFEGDWHTFLQMYKHGKLEHGSWFHHVRDWWAQHLQHPDQILWINYEELKADPLATIERLAKFLNVPLSEEELANVVKFSSLASMKEQSAALRKAKQAKHPQEKLISDRKPNASSHLREGRSGGWKNMFTVAQNEDYDAFIHENLKNCHGLTLYFGKALDTDSMHVE